MRCRERGILIAAALLIAGIGAGAIVGSSLYAPQVIPPPSLESPPPPPPEVFSLYSTYWQGASEDEATYRLVVRVVRADSVAPVTFDLPMCLHAPADASLNSEPSSCLSADSLEPRAYFNGCVSLENTSVKKGTLALDLSWGAGAQSVECKESIAIPLDRPFQTALRCGAALETEIQRRPWPRDQLAR